MDIFAAQLKRVTKVPIRKQRVRIDALNKGSASKGLTDDLDHLENHDQYFKHSDSSEQEHTSSKSHSVEKSEEQLSNESEVSLLGDKSAKGEVAESGDDVVEHDYIETQVIPEFLAYAKKPRIPREELKQLEEAKKTLKHLDLFI